MEAMKAGEVGWLFSRKDAKGDNKASNSTDTNIYSN